MQAERAIAQFNVRHCLPDPTGEQDRPLVVRRANQRKHNSGSHAGAGAGGAPPMHHGCLPQLPLMDVAAMAMAEMPVHLQHLMAMPQVRDVRCEGAYPKP